MTQQPSALGLRPSKQTRLTLVKVQKKEPTSGTHARLSTKFSNKDQAHYFKTSTIQLTTDGDHTEPSKTI